MVCPHCRAPLESQSRFCGACGKAVNAGASAAGELDGSRPKGQRDKYRGPLAMEDTEFAEAPRIVVTPPPDPYVGRMLGNRFQVEKKLGEGGFGAVYRGTQKGTGRKVALKLLHPDLTQDDNLVKRFQREGVILCGLRDAHTVTTYDFDQTEDGTLFIAMELLEGRSLHEVFNAEAPLHWERMFRIVRQMCSSLAEAHAQGIVHRDLKPENIYLENRPGNPEFVKILDFGIAKVVQGDGSQQRTQLTATGQTLGTLEYMSPEQLMGKDLDGRSDVYAIGVLAYELLTKRLPFPDFKNPAGLITAQLRQIPDPPSVAYPAGGIPPEVDRIVLKMLEKDKANRYQDMTELRTTCDELLAAAASSAPEASFPSMRSLPSRGSMRSNAPSSHDTEPESMLPDYVRATPPGQLASPGRPGTSPPGQPPHGGPTPGAFPPGPGMAPGQIMSPAPGQVMAPGQIMSPAPGQVMGPASAQVMTPAPGSLPPGAMSAGLSAPGLPAHPLQAQLATPPTGTAHSPSYPQMGAAAGFHPGHSYPHAGMVSHAAGSSGTKLWLWVVLAVLAIGGAVSIALALAS